MKHGNSSRYTESGAPSTRTAIGPIAHRQLKLASCPPVFAPVKLDFRRRPVHRGDGDFYWPVMRHGKCVHALPGGGEFVGGL